MAHTFPAPDGVLTLTFFADNGVRVTHSPNGREAPTFTVPRLLDFAGPVEKPRTPAPCARALLA